MYTQTVYWKQTTSAASGYRGLVIDVYSIDLYVLRCSVLSMTSTLCLQLREIAPEFYTPLQCHTSWVWVIWKFISDPEVGPWTRMKRDTREGTDGGLEPIALHTKTAFADITNLRSSLIGKAVKSS